MFPSYVPPVGPSQQVNLEVSRSVHDANVLEECLDDKKSSEFQFKCVQGQLLWVPKTHEAEQGKRQANGEGDNGKGDIEAFRAAWNLIDNGKLRTKFLESSFVCNILGGSNVDNKAEIKELIKAHHPNLHIHFKVSEANREVSRVNEGMIAKIKRVVFAILEFIFGKDERFEIRAQAEIRGLRAISTQHLSEGASFSIALKETLKLLNQCDNMPKSLRTAIGYAVKIQGKMASSSRGRFHELAKSIKEDLKNLEVGKSIAIPATSIKHGMIMMITREEDIDGNKTYKVVHHNTGFGLEEYHPSRKEGDNRIYQTGLVFNAVSGNDLFGEDSSFIQDVLANGDKSLWLGEKSSEKDSNDRLYQYILPKLGEPSSSDDDRLWRVKQVGRSCSGQCITSLIRSVSSDAQFEEFEKLAKLNLLFKTWKYITKYKKNNLQMKNIALEALRDLPKEAVKLIPQAVLQLGRAKFPWHDQSNFDIKGASELFKMLDHRDDRHLKSFKLNGININLVPSDEHGAESASFVDNLNIVFSFLCKTPHLTKADSVKALFFAEQALKISRERKPTYQELCKLQALFAVIKKFHKDRPLSKQHIYLLKFITSNIYAVTSDISQSLLRDPDPVKRTLQLPLDRFMEKVGSMLSQLQSVSMNLNLQKIYGGNPAYAFMDVYN